VHSSSPLRRIEPAIVALATFLLYAVTGARDVQWGDPAKLMLFVHEGGLSFSQEGHVGLVLWSWPFSLLPIEPFALRMHLSSAATMGIAMGVGYATLLGLGLSRPASRIGIAAVVVAHTVWFTAAMFESYPLVLLLLATSAWFLLIARKCLIPGVLIGLGVVVHPICSFGLLGIVYGLWKLGRGMGGVGRFLLGVMLGTGLPVLGLVLSSPPEATMGEVNWSSAIERYASLGNPIKNLPLLLGYAIYNFPSPALLLVGLGITRVNATERNAILLFALPHYIVAAFWLTQRSYLVPLPVYFLMAYLIAVGAERVIASRRSYTVPVLVLVTVLPMTVYAISPLFSVRLGIDRLIRDAPYREEATYFLRPWKSSETSAREYLDALDGSLPRGSVIVGDWTLITTARYAHHVENWRDDVLLIHAERRTCEFVARQLNNGRRVFVLDAQPGYIPGCLTRLGEFTEVPAVESLAELVRKP